MTKRETELLAKATVTEYTWLESETYSHALRNLVDRGLIEAIGGQGEVGIRRLEVK